MTASTLRPQLRSALLRQLHQKRSGKRSLLQQGFTLVELMIVIVIVGVLSAVALPNFLGAKSKAEAGSLIGTMSGYAKECAGNAVLQSTESLTGLPTTVTVTAATGGTVCSKGATVANQTAFTQPTKIGGLTCGVNSSGVAQKANGSTHATCTFTVDANGGITGAWS